MVFGATKERNCLLPAPLGPTTERIEDGDSGGLEIGYVARDHREAVLECGGGDHEIGTIIPESGAHHAPPPRRPQVEWHHPLAIERQHPVEPGSESVGKARIDRTLSLFTDVRAGEGTTVVLMMLNIFLLLICYSVIKTVREPLILLGGGAEVRSYAAAGQAVFERRADNLQALVDRIANDIGSDSAVINQHIIEKAGDLFDARADDIFFFNKGRLYANYLLMRELGKDFDSVIREKGLTSSWNATVETFRIASQLHPWVVWNGYPDSFLVPNHLAAQGFYLLRARTQLREITAILLK